MDWTLIFAVGFIALCVGYIVGGAIWTERPEPFPTRSYTETSPSDVDIDVPLATSATVATYADVPLADVPLTITRVSRPTNLLGPDHPLVYLFERDDGSQLLVHVYDDGEADLAERPDNSAVWGPPLLGSTR